MNRDGAVAQLLEVLRAKRDANAWLKQTLTTLAAEGNRKSFVMHCMSMAAKLLDGSYPSGTVVAATDQLWREMGGDDAAPR